MSAYLSNSLFASMSMYACGTFQRPWVHKAKGELSPQNPGTMCCCMGLGTVQGARGSNKLFVSYTLYTGHRDLGCLVRTMGARIEISQAKPVKLNCVVGLRVMADSGGQGGLHVCSMLAVI